MRKLPFDKKPKKKKLRKLKNIWDDAKTAFNKWVRFRNVPGQDPCDGLTNICVTCKKRVVMEKLNAGHFFHGRHWMSAMDERNVWPQCRPCNLYLSANLIEYSEFLRKLYGSEIIDVLRELRHTPWKPSREDLQAIITKYSVDEIGAHP